MNTWTQIPSTNCMTKWIHWFNECVLKIFDVCHCTKSHSQSLFMVELTFSLFIFSWFAVCLVCSALASFPFYDQIMWLLKLYFRYKIDILLMCLFGAWIYDIWNKWIKLFMGICRNEVKDLAKKSTNKTRADVEGWESKTKKAIIHRWKKKNDWTKDRKSMSFEQKLYDYFINGLAPLNGKFNYSSYTACISGSVSIS